MFDCGQCRIFDPRAAVLRNAVRRYSHTIPTVLAFGIVAASATVARAQSTSTWNTTTGNWSLSTNWSPTGVPASAAGTSLTFAGSTTYTSTNDVGTTSASPFILSTLIMTNTATDTLTGGYLDFVTGSAAPVITDTGSGAFTINSALQLATTLLVNITNSNTTLTLNGANSINGVISGSGGLMRPGTSIGTLVLAYAGNTYTGTTDLAAGTTKFVGSVGINTNSAFGNAASAILFGDPTTPAATSVYLTYNGSANASFDRPIDMSTAPGSASSSVTAGRQTIIVDNGATGTINSGTSTLVGNNPNTLTVTGAVTLGTDAISTNSRRQQFVAVQYNSFLIVTGLVSVSGADSGSVLVDGEDRGLGTVEFTNTSNSWNLGNTLTNGTLQIEGNITTGSGVPSALGENTGWTICDGATMAANINTSTAFGDLSNPRVLIDGNYTVNRNWTLASAVNYASAGSYGDSTANSYTLGTTANNTGTAHFTGSVNPGAIVGYQPLDITTGSASSTLDYDGIINPNTGAGAVNVNINQNVVVTTGANGTPSTGIVALNGANSYDGTTTVAGGTLLLGNAAGLGRTGGGTTIASDFGTAATAPTLSQFGGTTVNTGATLDLNGQAVGAEALTLVGGSLVNNSATAVTLNASNGLPTAQLTGTGTAANYTTRPTVAFSGGGGTGAAASLTLNIATINVTSGGAGYDANVKVLINGTNATDGTVNQALAQATVTSGAITSVTVRLMGGSFTTTPTITFSDAGATITSTAVANATSLVTGLDFTASGTGYTSAPTATVTGGNGATVATSANLVNLVSSATSSTIGGTGNLTINGVIAGGSGANLTKSGTGTVTLSGTDTYVGSTTVTGGNLNVTGNIAFSSGVTVSTGATLEGAGTVSGISLQSGGKVLAGPATGTGTLSGSSLTMDGGSTISYILGADPTIAGTSDLLALSGAFTKGAAGFYDFDFAGTSGPLSTTTPYNLVTFAGGNTTFSNSDLTNFNATNLPAGYAGAFSLSSTNGILSLVISSTTPEPSSAAMFMSLVGGFGICNGFARQRRRSTGQALRK